MVGAYAYDDYGKVIAQSGSVSTSFTYVGAYGVFRNAGNLYFMKNRWYDANTHQFLQRDPILYLGGVSNLYFYANGNPISNIDADGQNPLIWIAVTATGLVGYSKLSELAANNTIGRIKELFVAKINGDETADKILKGIDCRTEKEKNIDRAKAELILGNIPFGPGTVFKVIRGLDNAYQGKWINATKEWMSALSKAVGINVDAWEIIGIIRAENGGELPDWETAPEVFKDPSRHVNH